MGVELRQHHLQNPLLLQTPNQPFTPLFSTDQKAGEQKPAIRDGKWPTICSKSPISAIYIAILDRPNIAQNLDAHANRYSDFESNPLAIRNRGGLKSLRFLRSFSTDLEAIRLPFCRALRFQIMRFYCNLSSLRFCDLGIEDQKSRERFYTPPPPSPFSGQKAFFRGGGWGCIF